MARKILDVANAAMERARIQMFFLECELHTAKFGGPPILPPPDMQVTFEVPKPPKD